MAENEVLNPMDKLFDSFDISTEVPRPVVEYITGDELTELELAKERNAPDHSFNFLYGVAAKENSILNSVASIANRMTNNSYEPVKEMTPELMESLTEGLTDTRAIQEVTDTAINSSLSNAQALAEDYKKTQSNRELLASAGGKGTFATVVAALTDLPELAAIGFTTTIAPQVGGIALGKKAYNVSRAFKIGAGVGAAEAGIFEGIRATDKYDITGGDVAIAMAASTILSGSISSVSTAMRKKKEYQNLLKQYESGTPLTSNELAFLDSVDSPVTAQRALEEAEASRMLSDDIDLNSPITNVTEAQAAAAAPQQDDRFTAVRSWFSSQSKGMKSDNAFTRYFTDKLGLTSRGHSPDPETGIVPPVAPAATEYKMQREGQGILEFETAYQKPFAAWKKRTGGKQEDFDEAVTMAIRANDRTVAPEVREVADKIITANRRFLEDNIKANAAGFTEELLTKGRIDPSTYLARLFSDEGIDAVRRRFGMEESLTIVSSLVRKAIIEAQPDIATEIAESILKRTGKEASPEDVKNYIDAMASGYTKTVLSRPYASGGVVLSRPFDVEELEQAMLTAGINSDQINDAVYFLSKDATVRKHKRTQPRVILNEMATIDAVDVNGNIQTLRFTDLLENNIQTIQNAYNFQMAGAYGLAKVGIDTNVVGSSWDDVVKKVTDHAAEKGYTNTTEELKAMQFMYDGMTGRLGAKDTSPESVKLAVRRAKQFTYAAMMPMAGLSALMEVTNSLLEYSLKTNFKSMSRLREFYKRASDGQLDSKAMRELVFITGGKGEEILTASVNRATRFDAESALEPSIFRTTKVDEALGKISKAVSLGSGLLPVTAFNRRLTMFNYTQQWFDSARKGKAPFSETKMLQQGINPIMQRRIFNAINDPQTGAKLRPDGELDYMNVDQWTDKEAAEVWSMSLLRETTQNVQEVNIGSMNYVLRSTVGQIFGQFLSFPLAALEQQTARLGRRAMTGEAVAITKLMTASMLWGSLLYTTRVQLNAAGRSDADEYIKRQMAWDRFTMGAISQVGAASIFALAFQMVTGTATGTSNGFTPPAYNIFQAFLGLGDDISDGKFSETELRTFKNAIPMAKFYGVNQGLNYLAAKYGAD